MVMSVFIRVIYYIVAIQGPSSMYPTSSVRQNATMSPAFLDRMQSHMNSNQCEFPIDHFKMAATSSMGRQVAPSRPSMGPASSNPSGASQGTRVYYHC